MVQEMVSRTKRIVTLFLLLMSTLMMSACSPETTAQSINTDASVRDMSKGTNGEMLDIQSDNVSIAGYDASTQRMTVTFDNGKSYWYQPVDQSVWTAFYNAQPHPWSQVGYPALVESGIPYGRLN